MEVYVYEKLLPSTGYYCAAIPRPSGTYQQEFFDNIDDALAYALLRDKQGKTAFLAQSSFKTDENRKHPNVKAVRSFWIDIDCGATKPFPDQKSGWLALNAFCTETGLPAPIVISSGNGLYAYWPLKEDVDPIRWKTVAKLLGEVTKAYEFDIDSSRTADQSSVLRPIGTHNKKDPDNHKEVRLLYDADPVDFEAFNNLLTEALKAKGVVVKGAKKTKKRDIADIDFGQTSMPTSAYKIAERCAQIRDMKDTKGNLEEPLWYGCLAVLHHTEEAPDIIHAWSAGHPNYSEEETDAKIQHFVESGTGPTTCDRFNELNPSKCVGCPHRGEIKSPIVLGRILPDAVAEVDGEEEVIETPDGFKRTVDGIFFENSDGVIIKVYPYDLYLSSVAYDESLECAVFTVRHFLPHEGWAEFVIQANTLTEPKALHGKLLDNFIIVRGEQEKKLMKTFIEGYATKLQEKRRRNILMSQMGWRETQHGQVFALGQNLYFPNGDVEEASFGNNVPEIIKSVRPKGDREAWISTTKVFNEEGMEPFAFAFLSAAFGAPLMKFSGYAGAIVSMLGPSGVGKTLIGKWALSTYGDPADLVMLKDDTRVAMVARMGVYGNLPMYIDEITNIDPMELSTLAYCVTQGRDRARGTRSGVERKRINSWNTIALVSSNSSLIDKLSTAKANAAAEINRVFEYDVDHHPALNRRAASDIYHTIADNYGHVGQEYVACIVKNADQHAARIKHLTDTLEEKTRSGAADRFWIAVAAVTLYGASIAHELGLINMSLKNLTQWCIETIGNIREVADTTRPDCIDILARYLDANIKGRIIVRQSQNDKRDYVIIESPRGELTSRLELDTQLLYIAQSHFRQWCSTEYAAYSEIRKELYKHGVFLYQGQKNPRKNMGGGTQYSSGSVPCLVVSLKHEMLGDVRMKLISKASDLPLTAVK